jgi:hypothetical protein
VSSNWQHNHNESTVGASVESLIHFVTNCVALCCPSALPHPPTQPLPTVSCNFHVLFELPGHLPNCSFTRSNTHAQAPPTPSPAAVSDAIASYFFRRFPALVASVFHLVSKLWKEQTSKCGFVFSISDFVLRTCGALQWVRSRTCFLGRSHRCSRALRRCKRLHPLQLPRSLLPLLSMTCALSSLFSRFTFSPGLMCWMFGSSPGKAVTKPPIHPQSPIPSLSAGPTAGLSPHILAGQSVAPPPALSLSKPLPVSARSFPDHSRLQYMNAD